MATKILSILQNLVVSGMAAVTVGPYHTLKVVATSSKTYSYLQHARPDVLGDFAFWV